MDKFFKLTKSWCLTIFLLFPIAANSILALEGGTFGLNAGSVLPEKMGTLDFKSGYLGSISLGLKSGAIRYEVEANGSLNDVKTLSGNIISFSVLYNMYYDFEGIGINLIPYFGGGGGYVYVRSKVPENIFATIAAPAVVADDVEEVTGNHTGCYQLKVGVNYLLSEEFSFSLGYRYFSTLDISTLNDKSFSAHQITLGAIWYIG